MEHKISQKRQQLVEEHLKDNRTHQKKYLHMTITRIKAKREELRKEREKALQKYAFLTQASRPLPSKQARTADGFSAGKIRRRRVLTLARQEPAETRDEGDLELEPDLVSFERKDEGQGRSGQRGPVDARQPQVRARFAVQTVHLSGGEEAREQGQRRQTQA